MTRIFHIISDELATGTVKQLELLCRGLRGAGYHIHVASLVRRGPGRRQIPYFSGKLSYCVRNWSADPSPVAKLKRHIQAFDPQIIHTWDTTASVYGRLASAWEGQRPLVTSLRSLEFRPRTSPFTFSKWLISRSTRIIVNSPYMKTFYRQHGVDANRIEVVPNGIMVPAVTPPARSLRQELGLSSDAVLIGAVGDLRQHKRHKDLIWALDLLRVIRPNVHLIICGDGDDGPRLWEYCGKVHEYPLVHFLGHRDDICDLMPQFFCLWQASEREGCPNSILEAMAVGLPVIASDIPGHRAVLQDGVTGHLVRLGDRAEFARRTNLLLDDVDRARRFGAAGREHMAQAFAAEAMVEKYQETYEELLSVDATPRAA